MVIDLGFVLYPLIGVYLLLGMVAAIAGHSIFRRVLRAVKLFRESPYLRATPQPVTTDRRVD
jgi:hypothetical protein